MNTKMILLSGAISSVCVASSVDADTYGLLQDDISAVVPLETDSDGNAKECGLYLRIGAGVNFVMDSDGEDIFYSFAGTTGTVENKVLKFETGFEFNIAIGVPLTEQWSIEIMTGVAMNGLGSSTADAFVTNGITSLTGVSTFDDGDLYQVPIVANVRYEFDLNETLGLGVYAGAGAQYNNIKLRDGFFVEPGMAPIVLPGNTENTWSFRYQIGVDLFWDIAAGTTLGLNVRYSGTSDNDFAAFGTYGSFNNATIGATFSYTF